jgi:hypothetical protein
MVNRDSPIMMSGMFKELNRQVIPINKEFSVLPWSIIQWLRFPQISWFIHTPRYKIITDLVEASGPRLINDSIKKDSIIIKELQLLCSRVRFDKVRVYGGLKG